jgi:hypothetical protein
MGAISKSRVPAPGLIIAMLTLAAPVLVLGPFLSPFVARAVMQNVSRNPPPPHFFFFIYLIYR